ncbi:hypothetical protein C9417_22190 [Rhizobium sp. SEMIA 4088]|nr:hypothetical protein C9417_22190 [Rhizobium sp. SEMIA 4088]
MRILFGTWLLLGILPFPVAMGGMVLGYRFLPSAEWASKTSTFGNFTGLALGILMCGLSLVRQDLIPGGDIKKAGVVLFSPLFGFVLGRNAALVAGPMVLALVAGHHVELPYTIARANRPNERHCNSPLELQGLLFTFDRLCGVPDEIRKSLRPGMHIVVEGHGTSYGVFASTFRRDD